MATPKDNNRESENPKEVFDAESIISTGNATSEDIWLCKSTFFAVEWLVVDAVDSDALFDLVLQFKTADGTYVDDSADGLNNADCDSASALLTGSTAVRGINSFTTPYWARAVRFRINNDDNDTAAFSLWVHRDSYTRRKS